MQYKLIAQGYGFKTIRNGDISFVYRNLNNYCDINCAGECHLIGQITVIDEYKDEYNTYVFKWDDENKKWDQTSRCQLNFDSVEKPKIKEYVESQCGIILANPSISTLAIVDELKKVLHKYNAKIESDTDIRILFKNRIIVVERL